MTKKLIILLFLSLLICNPALAWFGSGAPFPDNIIIRNDGVYLEGTGKIIDLRANISATYDSISSTYHLAVSGGSGDLLADGTVPMTANWDIGNFDLTLKAVTGDGTGEFATITEGGVAVHNVTQSDVAYEAELNDSAGLLGALSDETGSGAGALSVFNISPQFETSILGNYLTASELLGTDGSKNIVSLAVATYPSLTELSYVKGLSSAVQTQINSKQATVTEGSLADNVIVSADIKDDIIVEADLNAIDAAGDEECLTYESDSSNFEWQTCGGAGGGITNLNLPIYSAKLTGAFVVFTPPTADACAAGAGIDAGDGNWRLLFDATTDECATWQFVMPDNYGSAPKVDIHFSMASGEANEVEWEAAIMCSTSGTDTADVGTASFSNVAVGTATTVSATAGEPYVQSITITDDSCAASDVVWLVISTDANDATSDDATGDREVIVVEFNYTGS